MNFYCWLLVSVFWVGTSVVNADRVILTGDSITVGSVGYADEFADLVSGVPGLESDFAGQPGVGGYEYRDGNFATAVTDKNPDVIVFMLGINDALKVSTVEYPNRALGQFQAFTRGVEDAFNQFDTSTASRVIVLSLLPIDETVVSKRFTADGPDTNLRIVNDYNPWLVQEVDNRNAFAPDLPSYEYVDLFSQFPIGLLDSDGLHLSDGEMGGQQWLANAVLGNVTAVPEPSSFVALLLLSIGAITIPRVRSIHAE